MKTAPFSGQFSFLIKLHLQFHIIILEESKKDIKISQLDLFIGRER